MELFGTCLFVYSNLPHVNVMLASLCSHHLCYLRSSTTMPITACIRVCRPFSSRYVDAIKAFNQILLTIIKTKSYLEGTAQFEQVMNRNEQIYALLAICLALCPHGKLVEEGVNSQLREKHAEKLQRMQRGDLAVFDELFSFACPRFITPSPPDSTQPLVNYNQVGVSPAAFSEHQVEVSTPCATLIRCLWELHQLLLSDGSASVHAWIEVNGIGSARVFQGTPMLSCLHSHPWVLYWDPWLSLAKQITNL